MVNALDRASLQSASTGDLIAAVTRLLSPNNEFPTQAETGQPECALVAFILESLTFHVKSPTGATARAEILQGLNGSLDPIFMFLAIPDEEVVEATVRLLEQITLPFPAATILEAHDNLVAGLGHPESAVRNLVLSLLKKLEPSQWTQELAVAALKGALTGSLRVFEQFKSLLNSETMIHVLLQPPCLEVLLQLAHDPLDRFRVLEIVGLAARLSAAAAQQLHLAKFFLPLDDGDLEYAVLTELSTSLILPTSTADAGTPTEARIFLVQAGVVAAITERTESIHPESRARHLIPSLTFLLAYVAAVGTENDAYVPRILDVAATALLPPDNADLVQRDAHEIVALATLRGLSALPTLAPVLAHARLVQALAKVTAPLRGGNHGSAAWFVGLLQLLCAWAPLDRDAQFVRVITANAADPAAVLVAATVQATTHIDENVRSAAYAAQCGIAQVPWGQTELGKPERVNYLLDRTADDGSPAAKRARYTVVELLAASEMVKQDADVATQNRFGEYLREGPFYVVRDAAVALGDAA
ncbi:hypothetical protein AMAG_11764 [Allomyces macrogynus ATCC 38327]|uniref:26S proteasome non-ATPase regulatory subunit 5 n=1 Tax=Allomyces macrogynus (strain ATCC 38327) TaxID=578462 RepID=A0A0L0SVN5_ALLM3|nr:hypothetical protein AMAG_11764 [Allomyces macrogynus ATCC 38327]|eukprot:KNE66648.1 hypothetical protein AMAG_11764 [Allomyces macrogynus ATCC 38327]